MALPREGVRGSKIQAPTVWQGTIRRTRQRSGAPTPDSEWLMTSRRGGFGLAPFDDWNLAGHVGDDERTVLANRTRIADLAGLPASSVVMMRQCHSAEVAVIDSVPHDEVVGVDALVSATPGVILVALAADCVPLVLADPGNGVVAAVHSGWQGMVSDVSGAAVAAMCDLGADPQAIVAVMGPAICGSCYPVPPERAAQAAAVAPGSSAVAPDGQPGIDVRAGLAEQFAARGITSTSVGGCTAESPDLFSYRRDGRTGRQGAAIWRHP